MGWTNPMPVRFGGGGRRLVVDLFATARDGTGSLLNGGEGTETYLENQVIARMMASGWRSARCRAAQADPRKLSTARRRVVSPDGVVENLSPLERWERILGIRPSPTSTPTARRLAVFNRRALRGRSDRAELLTLVARVFGTWETRVAEYSTAGMTATMVTWPDALNTAAYPGQLPYADYTWTSTIYYFTLTVYAPAGTTQEAKDARKAEMASLLEDVLPAHAEYLMSVT